MTPSPLDGVVGDSGGQRGSKPRDPARAVELQTMRRVSLRLLPFVFVLYIFNFLDRTNVSIAALQMNRELGFSAAAFGFGAGIFYLSYAVFEVPSNLILVHVGARRWIARIMITWGLIACATAWVHTPAQFYTMRVLLGVAEAGFFPGIIYYLGQWFPVAYRSRAIARFSIAIPLSQALGGPLGGALLRLDGQAHLSGWQWLFMAEGLPSVLLGLVVLVYLTDRPELARWLSAEQRHWLADRLDRERDAARVATGAPVLAALFSKKVLALAVPIITYITVSSAYIFWAPLLVRDAMHVSDSATGLITGAIAAAAGIVMLVAGARSDRSQERHAYASAGLAVAAIGCIGAAFVATGALRVAALALIPLGCSVFVPTFWCLPTQRLSGAVAAAVIGLLNAIGSLGGFAGPAIVGLSKRATGSFTSAFILLAGLALAGSVALLVLRARAGREQAAHESPRTSSRRDSRQSAIPRTAAPLPRLLSSVHESH
jgi:ACS family tartrate transporter-like MFS transporter